MDTNKVHYWIYHNDKEPITRKEMTTAFTIITLSAVGLTNIMVRSIIIKPAREFLMQKFPINDDKITIGYLVNCPVCSGFWCGLLLGTLGYWISDLTIVQSIILPLLTGFATSGLSGLYDNYIFRHDDIWKIEMQPVNNIKQ